MSGSNPLAGATAGTPVPPQVLASLVGFESHGDPNAVNPVSGASGLGAVLPSTARDPGYGVAPLPPGASPQDQAKFSAQYLYARGKAAGLTDADWQDPQKVKVALAAYHGPATDANGVNGADYANRVLGGPGAGGAMGYGPGMVAQTMGIVSTANAQKWAAQAPIFKQMQDNLAKDQTRFDKISSDYKPYDPPAQPKPPENDPLKGFSSAAAIFATIAAAFTHTPAVNAMRGMAAAINATKQNDWQAYQAHYNQWKDATDQMLQRHKLQSDDMKDAMDMMKNDLSTGVAMANAVAAQSDDHVASALLAQGQYEKLYELQTARNSSAAKMQTAALELQEKQPLILASGQFTAAQNGLASAEAAVRANPQDPLANATLAQAKQNLEDAKQAYAFAKNPNAGAGSKPGTPAYILQQYHDQALKDNPALSDAEAWSAAQAKAKSSQEGGGLGDDAVKLVAGQLLAGDQQAIQGLARNPANMTKIMNEYAKQAKDQGLSPEEINDRMAEFQGTKAAARTLGTRQANMEVAANEVKRMLPLALDASAKVDRTNYPKFNQILLDAQKGTGDPNVVQFGLAANSLIYEYAKFLNPTGIPTDSDKAKATEILSTAWSSGQFKAATDQISKEIAVGRSAITDTRQELNSGLTTATSAPTQQTPAVGPGSPSAAPAQKVAFPSELVHLLHDGKITTFGNGTKWTIQNGQPVQVQ